MRSFLEIQAENTHQITFIYMLVNKHTTTNPNAPPPQKKKRLAK